MVAACFPGRGRGATASYTAKSSSSCQIGAPCYYAFPRPYCGAPPDGLVSYPTVVTCFRQNSFSIALFLYFFCSTVWCVAVLSGVLIHTVRLGIPLRFFDLFVFVCVGSRVVAFGVLGFPKRVEQPHACRRWFGLSRHRLVIASLRGQWRSHATV